MLSGLVKFTNKNRKNIQEAVRDSVKYSCEIPLYIIIFARTWAIFPQMINPMP
jgi:hypothetical protein